MSGLAFTVDRFPLLPFMFQIYYLVLRRDGDYTPPPPPAPPSVTSNYLFILPPLVPLLHHGLPHQSYNNGHFQMTIPSPLISPPPQAPPSHLRYTGCSINYSFIYLFIRYGSDRFGSALVNSAPETPSSSSPSLHKYTSGALQRQERRAEIVVTEREREEDTQSDKAAGGPQSWVAATDKKREWKKTTGT